MIAGLYGIVDVSANPALDEVALSCAWLAGGVRILQLRMKGADVAEVSRTLDALVPLCAEAGCLLIVNDHVELAARHGVGVHLGQDDMDPREARRILGEEAVIGWSTHDLQQVRRASERGVDYIGYGPIFSAAAKHRTAGDAREPMPACGLASLSAAVAAATVPVVAIGGIDAERLPFVLATGVQSVAMISAVARAPDPARAAAELVAACR